MLEPFDRAGRAMHVGDSKTFALQFPADYQGKEVAGKEADFLVTMKAIERQHLPEVDGAFIRSLGIAAGTVEALRADVKKNLEREVKFRVLARNKAAAMEANARPGRVYDADGRSVGVRYEVVEADALITSHNSDLGPNPAFPPELQPRDRTRAMSQEQIAGIAANLQPERLGFSTD